MRFCSMINSENRLGENFIADVYKFRVKLQELKNIYGVILKLPHYLLWQSLVMSFLPHFRHRAVIYLQNAYENFEE